MTPGAPPSLAVSCFVVIFYLQLTGGGPEQGAAPHLFFVCCAAFCGFDSLESNLGRVRHAGQEPLLHRRVSVLVLGTGQLVLSADSVLQHRLVGVLIPM